MNIVFGLHAPGLLWPACCRSLCVVCVHFQAGRPGAAGSTRLPSLSYESSLKWLLKLNSTPLYCFYTATTSAKGAAALLIMPSVRVCSTSTFNRMWFFPQVLLKVPALYSFVFFCIFFTLMCAAIPEANYFSGAQAGLSSQTTEG